MRKRSQVALSAATLLAASALTSSLILAAAPAASPTAAPTAFGPTKEFPLLPNHPPAVRGALPGGPVFIAGRPKPPEGQTVLDPETLLTPPDDTFTMQRRNNFYKKDDSDGLYRWAASGHWSNYDESKTGDWKKTIPDPLKLNNGQIVKDADTWWKVRRPEIVKLFESYVYGKIPNTAPKVVWTKNPDRDNGDGTITCSATGVFVNQDGTPFVAPAGAGRRGPAGGNPNIPGANGGQPGVMADPMERFIFIAAPAGPGGGAAGGAAGAAAGPGGAPRGGGAGGFGGGRGGAGGGGGPTISYTIPKDAPGPVPLISGGGNARGLGFGTVSFGINAPNVRSNPPAPDDWGAIRRYGWGISRGIDYLETDPRVDAHQIAIQGASIGGKQALVAGAFDQRINMVAAFVSGELGAAMSRHDWGETIDDVAQLSADNYCDNFQYWVGHFDECPTDSHMFIALMAGRHLLCTGGTQDQWSDPTGVFWGCYYASPVWKLLGQKGIDEQKPPEPATFIGEELVFYNHVGGHAVLPPENQKNAEMIQKFFKVKPKAP